MAGKGLVIGGLRSGIGKTLVSLGLMRACRNRGIAVAAAKAGPDYIDPGFHAAALGSPSINLDPFAMKPPLLATLAVEHGGPENTLLVEGVMGLHDGGEASTAHISKHLDIPMVLLTDVRGQIETAAVVAEGIRSTLKSMGVKLAGVILNHCSSERHADMVRGAMEDRGIVSFGALRASEGVEIPSRHLGLVQAHEIDALEDILENAARICEGSLDIPALMAAVKPISGTFGDLAKQKGVIAPPAQRIAMADDVAFGFGYEHLKKQWRAMGAELAMFSPLADEAPDKDAGFVFLPGGYPELHLASIASADRFLEGLRTMAEAGIPIYGECGGYMVLGRNILGNDGERYPMAGLLGVETGFLKPERHLGYRRLKRIGDAPLPENILGHEFHYSTVIVEEGEPLFEASDREGKSLGPAGLCNGSVSGSYMHMIAAA